MEIGPPARPIGEIAIGVVARIAKMINADAADMRLAGPPALNDDVPCGEPALWRILRAAAFEAKHRGAKISVICSGYLVSKGGRSEIVRFEQAECGVLDRALNRVAPYAWELETWR